MAKWIDSASRLQIGGWAYWVARPLAATPIVGSPPSRPHHGHMRPHQLVITAGLIVSAALAGCGNDSGQPATAADVPSAASSAEQPATTDVPDQGDGSGDDSSPQERNAHHRQHY